jgi:hypothetical protein
MLFEHNPKHVLGMQQIRTSLTVCIGRVTCEGPPSRCLGAMSNCLPPRYYSFPFSRTISSTPSGPVDRSQPPIIQIRHSQCVSITSALVSRHVFEPANCSLGQSIESLQVRRPLESINTIIFSDQRLLWRSPRST